MSGVDAAQLYLNLREKVQLCPCNAIIDRMDAEEIRFHLRGRWKAVEKIEREELRATTIKQNWIKLNQIMLRARRLKLSRGDDDEMEVFLRWARLKEKHETS